MTKHVTDHPKTTDKTRAAREYARIDAAEMPRPQTRALQKRPRSNIENARLKAFTKIERHVDS